MPVRALIALAILASAAASRESDELARVAAKVDFLQGKVAALEAAQSRIVPKLDPVSDKKFFDGKSADYPTDKRPLGTDAFSFPYPIMQDDNTYDKDFVADENNDNGAWAAQMTYDKLRSRYYGEAEDIVKAKEHEKAEELEDEEANKLAKDGEKNATDAQDAYDKAKAENDALNKTNGKAESEVDDEAKKLSKEEQEFEDCKAQLARAKAELKILMDKQATMLVIRKKEAEDRAAKKEARKKQKEQVLKLKAERRAQRQAVKAKKEAERAERHARIHAVKAAYEAEVKTVKVTEEELNKAAAKLRAARQKQIAEHDHQEHNWDSGAVRRGGLAALAAVGLAARQIAL